MLSASSLNIIIDTYLYLGDFHFHLYLVTKKGENYRLLLPMISCEILCTDQPHNDLPSTIVY